ncbi:MAG: MotA/TolQ/ExbB proton channel family protein [Deltaproteobacteria bacterium]|jgi:biopolymer transport protein TolQ|nr:MotA/TolQ/ExbB proton channel family protein [Deltaproteobacteria bacterium]
MIFLFQAVEQATLVSQGVLGLLALMSLASWALIFGTWRRLRRTHKQCAAILEQLDHASNLAASLDLLSDIRDIPFYHIARRAIREFNRISKTGDAALLFNDNVRRALRYGIGEQMGKLKAAVPLLATSANTAPFIGLFGTVWGIMHSFHAIAQMKSVSLATVAPGIAEALIATAMGLFVAIPATLGYNIFRAKLSGMEGECINFAGLLLNRMQHEAPAHPRGIRFADLEEAA